MPEATRQAQLHKYGLDKPLPEQYVRYIWHVLHVDFGIPFQSPTETVIGLIARAWPVTIRIGLPTIVISYTARHAPRLHRRAAPEYAGSITSSPPWPRSA